MASPQTVITVTHGTEAIGTINTKYLRASTKPHEECVALSNLFAALSAAQRTGSYTVQVTSGDAVAASGTVTFSGHSSTSDTFLINGQTFTCVASGATNNQFNVGTTAATQATNVAAAITASTTALISGAVSATAATSVVTVTALVAGVSGNWITTAKGTDAPTVQTWSAARLTSGAVPVTIYPATSANGASVSTYHCGK